MDIEKLIEIKNNQPLADFEGLSPSQMYQLLNNFDYSDILKVNDTLDSLKDIPIIKLLNEIINKVDSESGTKLTSTESLPVKIVKSLYEKDIIKDFEIEAGITKLSKEVDSESIHCTKLIGLISGYLRKSKNRLYVTTKGKLFTEDRSKLNFILNTFGYKFNFAYFDDFDNEMIAQSEFKYALYLLYKYGDTFRKESFYAEKYFKAFPDIGAGENIDTKYGCYSIRTFKRFLRYFGFIEFKDYWSKNTKIKTTELFSKYIEFNL